MYSVRDVILNKVTESFPEFSTSSLLVHIAFHYNEDRFKYLFSVLEKISLYDFERIDVYIDTNSEKLLPGVALSDYPGVSSIEVSLHENLDHPFLLTWAHRANMESLKDEYDYFMYVEDDIAVSYDSLLKWREDSIFLDDYGKIRGFIRTEVNAKNELVSSDYKKPIKCKEIVFIDEKTFIAPANPYQGFWFYSKKQFDGFYGSECWVSGNCDWGVRERASAGMIWKDSEPQEGHCLVIPLINQSIPGYVYVDHLPNNYALNNKEKHGSLKISKIVPNNILFRLCLRIRKYINEKHLSD
jgi:hypothetical protein